MIARALIPIPIVEQDLGLAQVDPEHGRVDARLDVPRREQDWRARAVEVDQLDAEDPQHPVRVEVLEARADDRVHRDQEHELEDQRQAARGGVDAALLVERLGRLLDLDPIALEALLDLLELGAQELHPLLADDLLAVQRDEDHPDQQGDGDDRDDDAPGHLLDRDQADEQGLEDRGEQEGQQRDRVAGVGRVERNSRRRQSGRRDRGGGLAGGQRRAGAGQARTGGSEEQDEDNEQAQTEPGLEAAEPASDRAGHGGQRTGS